MSSLLRPGLREEWSRQLSVVISVPCPSTVMPPPSRTIGRRSARHGIVRPGAGRWRRRCRKVVLLTPGIEDEVGHGAGAVATREEDRAAVAQPGIVDGHLDHFDVGAAVTAGHAALAGTGQHEHGFESGDRASDGRIVRLGQQVLLAPEVAADLRGPADDAALMRLPFGRHAKAEGAGGGPPAIPVTRGTGGGWRHVVLLCARAARSTSDRRSTFVSNRVRSLYDRSPTGRNGGRLPTPARSFAARAGGARL